MFSFLSNSLLWVLARFRDWVHTKESRKQRLSRAVLRCSVLGVYYKQPALVWVGMLVIDLGVEGVEHTTKSSHLKRKAVQCYTDLSPWFSSHAAKALVEVWIVFDISRPLSHQPSEPCPRKRILPSASDQTRLVVVRQAQGPAKTGRRTTTTCSTSAPSASTWSGNEWAAREGLLL